MNDRLAPERENEIRASLTEDLESTCGALCEDGLEVLAELDACRRGLAEERARTTQLTEALRETNRALFAGRNAMTRLPQDDYLDLRSRNRALLAECGAGTEQPA